MTKSATKLPRKLLPFVWHFVRAQWPWFLALQIFSFAWSLDHTLFPYVLSLLIDAITQLNENRAGMWPAVKIPLILGAILWVGAELMYRASGFLTARVIPKLEASVRMSMFDYVSHHSYSYFSSNFAGSIANKIGDMPRSMTHILQLIISLFLPALLAITISTILFAKLNFIFALILVSWLIVHIGICLAFAKNCDKYADIHAESRSSLAGKIVDSLSNHLNVRLFARHRYEEQYLSAYQHDEKVKHTKSLNFIEKMKIGMAIGSFLGPGLALNWYMLYSWQNYLITTGEVVFIFNTSWNIIMMAWLVGLELPTLFKEIGVCRQALTIVQDSHEIVDDPKAIPLKVSKGEITFEHVSFHYTPNQIIFHDINVTIQAGTKVGLVGSSGSGKTTFVHLILRYFDAESGRILIDGEDIAMVTQDTLRSQIGMIPQDTSLFHRTLMENIRYGRLDATDEEVIEAAKKANCHEFIEKLPEKYHTLAGERGVKLSGGQRQRLAIARAILKNAPILILDEATSALDSATEMKIQEGLEHLIQGRTAIVIAHRLSTLSGMDRILVFKDGKIVEDGTHDELIAAGGHYATMWDMQAWGFLPDAYEEEE